MIQADRRQGSRPFTPGRHACRTGDVGCEDKDSIRLRDQQLLVHHHMLADALEAAADHSGFSRRGNLCLKG